MTRYEKALELLEKGIPTDAIAARMGTTVLNVNRLIYTARKKREKESA